MRMRPAPSEIRSAISFWRAEGAREENSADVGAGNQQDADAHAEAHVDALIAHVFADFVAQAIEKYSAVGVAGGIELFQARGDGIHGLLGLGESYAGLQAAEDVQPAVEPIAAFFFGEREWNPQIRAAHQRKMEIFGHDADDGVGFSVQRDLVFLFRWDPH